MNLERLKQVHEFISALPPEACDMSDWIALHYDQELGYVTFSLMQQQGFSCGTVACIAGWTAMMAHGATPKEKPYDSDVEDEAAAYLGLTPHESFLLFKDFPTCDPEEGWKAWMMQRLEDCIEAKAILSWDVEDCYDYDDSDDDPDND